MRVIFKNVFLQFSISCITAISASNVSAQPGESVESLQRQLQEIQSRIDDIQGQSDPFGKRVRSVGRQRTNKPEIIVEDVLTIR
ncbi:MAG: hypothetical protein AAGA30_19550, partial [Planctomycetota bacterium]